MGKESKLAFCASAASENRNGPVVARKVTSAMGAAEICSGISLVDRLGEEEKFPIKTVGADKGYYRRAARIIE